jgi:hypothetical protein
MQGHVGHELCYLADGGLPVEHLRRRRKAFLSAGGFGLSDERWLVGSDRADTGRAIDVWLRRGARCAGLELGARRTAGVGSRFCAAFR